MFIDIGRGLVAGLPALALPPAILDAVERGLVPHHRDREVLRGGGHRRPQEGQQHSTGGVTEGVEGDQEGPDGHGAQSHIPGGARKNYMKHP